MSDAKKAEDSATASEPEAYELSRPSLASVEAAAVRAEASARVLAAAVADRFGTPTIVELAGLILKRAVRDAQRVLTADMERIAAETPLPVFDPKQVMKPDEIAYARTLPEEERLEFMIERLKGYHDTVMAAFARRKAVMDYHFAERARASWEWAFEYLRDLARELGATSRRCADGFKSLGSGSSLEAIARLRELRAAIEAGTDAGDLRVAAIPAGPARKFCDALAWYESEAHHGVSLDEAIGVGRGRRWYTTEKIQQRHAAAAAASKAMSALVAKGDPGFPDYCERHLRRIVRS
ncbi:MAG TPA: hypothetical protein VN808_08170 [Stellaceae bacterium]|nr:hypothetical protein [Stellaceae bacterium]